MAESERKSHWRWIAEMLGAPPSAQPEPEPEPEPESQPEPVPQPAMASPDEPPRAASDEGADQTHEIEERPAPRESRAPAQKPKAAAPRAKQPPAKAPRTKPRASHWGSLAEQLGVEVPPDVFKEEIEAPIADAADSASASLMETEPVAEPPPEWIDDIRSTSYRDEPERTTTRDKSWQAHAEDIGVEMESEEDAVDDVDDLEAEPADERSEDESRPKRRRRRRRRGRREREEQPVEDRQSEDESDVEEMDEPRPRARSERPERHERRPAAATEPDEDEDGEVARPKHTKIPTWDQAIGFIVDSNLSNRTRSQGSRGRGRGHRR